MPATFAHRIIAKAAIDNLSALIRKRSKKEAKINSEIRKYAGILAIRNNFVLLGSLAPDYPYLTEILTTDVLKISHTWANRMHYENVDRFITEGIQMLNGEKKNKEIFEIRLAWLCGYVSHVIADAYVHPVVNSVVGGPYVFTQNEHGKCELIQDIYIFKKETNEDIVTSDPHNERFGFHRILDECSDQSDGKRDHIHPEIKLYWTTLLKKAHPSAVQYFEGIDPDKWHYNYRGRVNFCVDPSAIFRHVLGMANLSYKKEEDITKEEREKYIEHVILPNAKEDHYDNIFNKTVEKAVEIWLKIFSAISNNIPEEVSSFIKNWNLDTGVNESVIDLWTEERTT